LPRVPRRLLDRVDGGLGEALEWLKELVSIPTVNPPGRCYRDFIEAASRILRGLGFSVEVYDVPDSLVRSVCPECAGEPRYILIARKGSGRPVIQFNGHYDVVPPGQGWSMDPFKPVVREGRLYGRGAVDMKGGIAAAMLAASAFLSEVGEFNGTLEFALVPDEEIGGVTGTGYMLLKGLSSPDFTIIAEPSGSSEVWIGHKGALWGFIEVYGKQTHGSTPWVGVNAFEYMARIALRLAEEYVPRLKERRSSYDYGSEEAAHPTITLGGEVRGGAKINIVPGYYAFSFDRRLIVEENTEQVEREINSVVSRIASAYPEVRVRVKVTNRLEPAITDPRNPYVDRLVQASLEANGVKPRLLVCPGGLDLHYYSERGLAAVAYGPGPEAAAHIADEYVEVEELRRVARTYAAMLYLTLTQAPT